MLEITRAVGDTLSPIESRLQDDGVPRDLTNLDVKFEMVDEAGNVVVAETETNVTKIDAVNGEVSYDFQPPDVANPGTFYIFWTVYENSQSEPDTYPDEEDGIKLILYSKTANREDADPSIDIIGMANAPARTRTVEGTVEERSVSELVKADQYAASKEAADTMPWGIRVNRIRPGGTCT